MYIKNLPLFLTSALLTVACTTPNTSVVNSTTQHPSKDSQHNPIVLATIQHLDTDPDTTQGNQAKLIKAHQDFCQIEFTGFYTLGKVVENWAFKNNTLISATTSKFTYRAPNLSETELQTQSPSIAKIESHTFDITLPEKIKNFENLKKHFNEDLLKHCQT